MNSQSFQTHLRTLPVDEQKLLEAASAWNPCEETQREFDNAVYARLADERGIDFATAALYSRFSRHPQTVHLREDLTLAGCDEGLSPPPGALLGLVPGALYREYPGTGADGASIREIAESLGWQSELVPVHSDGAPQQNGEMLLDWLDSHAHRPILLLALSKGAADVKAALVSRGAEDAFRSVIGWINFGGILDGSPMAAWVLERRLVRWFFRGLFRCAGHDFRLMTELQYRAGEPNEFSLQVPDHLRVVHVAGFPLRQHLSSARARRWHHRLSDWGPNDSVTVLADMARWPGVVWPVWGTDHYLQSRWHPQELLTKLLRWIAASSCLPSGSQLVSPTFSEKDEL